LTGGAEKRLLSFSEILKTRFFNITANLDITELYGFCQEKKLSIALANLFFSLETANEIREFRLRLKGEEVIEYEKIHATQTILNEDETFSFCYFELRENVFDFNAAGKTAIEKYKQLKTFDVETERLDLIYYSVIPWISFTSFKHASRFDNRQTVPRIVFGKMFEENRRRKIPLSVEAHHALMDGFHVGKYFKRLQEKYNNPLSAS
jgi:chloramphenicol O-acetyltransferase type A